MWSAFWLQSASIGTRFDAEWCGVENDIMEHFFSGMASCGNIYGGYGAQFKQEGRVKFELEDTEDGFHRFGLLWSEDEYVFYCDGKEVSRCTEAISKVPQFILLTTEVRGYRNNTPLKVGEYCKDYSSIRVGTIDKRQDGFTDDAFVVDYVRVYDEVK